MNLHQVRARAYAGETDPGAAGPAAAWLDAYRALSTGDFARALERTGALLGDPAWGGPARITRGSTLRHLTRYDEALVVDAEALELAGEDAARAEALTSMAADAVGAADPDACAERLAAAARALDAADRRGQIRLSWVRTEHALLTGDPAAATGHARLALADARALGWPRHVAKSLLFLGAALEAAGSPEAPLRLREAVERADVIGARPIGEAAAALLARAGGPDAAG